jgi:hypothetical protein
VLAGAGSGRAEGLRLAAPHGVTERCDPRRPVPTLFRFLFVVVVLAGIGAAVVFALATLVEPQPREISTTIPANRLPAR